MDTPIIQAERLLKKKQELFERFEQATAELAQCSETVDMEKYITIRGQLATDIDEIDRQLRQVLAHYGEASVQALQNRCERGSLPKELLPVFDQSQQILSIVYRIEKVNRSLLTEYERIKLQSLEQIKTSSDTVKVNRYLLNLSAKEKGNNFGSV